MQTAFATARVRPPRATLLPLRHGGCHGTGERGLVVEERIIPPYHGIIDARLQVSQVAQRADDLPTALLDHRGHVGAVGGSPLTKRDLSPWSVR
jgi:hypothetical protein